VGQIPCRRRSGRRALALGPSRPADKDQCPTNTRNNEENNDVQNAWGPFELHNLCVLDPRFDQSLTARRNAICAGTNERGRARVVRSIDRRRQTVRSSRRAPSHGGPGQGRCRSGCRRHWLQDPPTPRLGPRKVVSPRSRLRRERPRSQSREDAPEHGGRRQHKRREGDGVIGLVGQRQAHRRRRDRWRQREGGDHEGDHCRHRQRCGLDPSAAARRSACSV
jgi:hypothetical protein